MEINAKVLILDEPTSSLDADEVDQLFRVIRDLRDRGVAILFVSHFLEQVYEISDRMTVLRNGKLVGEYLTRDLSRMSLISKMIGKDMEALAELDQAPPATRASTGGRRDALHQASGLGRKGSVSNVTCPSIRARSWAWPACSAPGRTEIARLFFGADKADEGSIKIKGAARQSRSPRTAIDKRHRVLLGGPQGGRPHRRPHRARQPGARPAGQQRLGAPHPPPRPGRTGRRVHRGPRHPPGQPRRARSATSAAATSRRCSSPAGWSPHPELLILDEPTRGIDIGAKTQIQKLVSQLAAEGMSILFISSELEEVLRAQRPHRRHQGQGMVAEINNDDVSVEDVMTVIAGGAQ